MNICDAEKIIAHLPKDDAYGLELSGGDPFSDYPLLVAVLELLGGRRLPRTIYVHTTGQWAFSFKAAKSKYDKLLKLGVDVVCFLCDDIFHEAGGLNRKRFDTAVKAATEVFGSEGVSVRDTDFIIPLGRGADKSMEPYYGKRPCYVKGCDFNLDMQWHISHTGQAYMCDNSVAPLVGNMITTPYEELVAATRLNPCHRYLASSGPYGLACALGLDEVEWSSRIKEVGECSACIELFREYSDEIEKLPA